MSAAERTLFVVACTLPSLVISLAATYVVRSQAIRWGLIDLPGERKVHAQPTPRGGGLAIWLAVILVFAAGQVLLWLVEHVPAAQALVPPFAQPHLAGIEAHAGRLWLLLAAGTILAGLGLLDDRGGLPWHARLAVEFAVAAVCVWLLPSLRLTAFLPYPLATGALSVLWIVALINAFNMLDNMDGLSAGVAVIAGGMLAAVLLTPSAATERPQLFVAGLLLVLVGAVLGFLWHNRPPARIFMGDSGAYFIGFVIAAGTLLASYTGYHSPQRHAILAPLLVMAVPLYDMVSVILIRLREGRSPFEADKNHLSHRLVDLGLTKVQAVLTVYLTTATCGLGALLLSRVDATGAVLIVLLIGCVLGLVAILETTARRTIRR